MKRSKAIVLKELSNITKRGNETVKAVQSTKGKQNKPKHVGGNGAGMGK